MSLVEIYVSLSRKTKLKMKETLSIYIDLLNKNYSTHETTEHSFRGEFKQLCETSLNGEYTILCSSMGNTERYTLINEPRRKSYGDPDYELLKGDAAIAFIEAKNKTFRIPTNKGILNVFLCYSTLSSITSTISSRSTLSTLIFILSKSTSNFSP